MTGLSKSPWILHYDASSCNGCDIETLACLTPHYDVERLGVINTGNPKHADIFLVTGAVNEQSREVLQNIFRQMPDPKVVVAIGACASTGGIFCDCYNISGGVDTAIPVDVYVPGCAVRPEAIIDGVAKAIGVLEDKHKRMSRVLPRLEEATLSPSGDADREAIRQLRVEVAQNDQAIYGPEAVPPDFDPTESGIRELKMEVAGMLMGAICGQMAGGVGQLFGVAVHPHVRGRGLTERLVGAMERELAGAERFQIRVGGKQKRRVERLMKLGYSPVEPQPDGALYELLEKQNS